MPKKITTILTLCMLTLFMTSCSNTTEDSSIEDTTEAAIASGTLEEIPTEETTTSEITTTDSTLIVTTTKATTTTPEIKTTVPPKTTAEVITTTPATTTSATEKDKYTPPATVTTPVTTTPSVSDQDYIAKVLELVNNIRTENGLGTFSTNTSLSNAANTRASEVCQSFSHTRPDGTSCFTVLSDNNISYSTCGENIAQGYTSPQDVVDGWMNSSGHRANILNSSFTTIGIGYDSSCNGWVQLFIG